MHEPQELLDVALDAARAAVAVQREHAGRLAVEDWATKGVADYVTYVDREAEREAVARIRAAFPEHAVVAEEGTGAEAAARRSDWTWLVDPLDGTTNYLHRYPAYAASVAVLRAGAPIAGAIVSGATGEEWSASLGGGARKDGQPIAVSGIDRLDRALIGTGFPFRAIEHLPAYLGQFDAVLRRTAGIRRAGSAALDLCHVATGYFDGFWELHLAPWDVAAGMLIVREAGGVVTRLDGAAEVLDGPGTILAGNPAVHALLGELVRAAAETTRDGAV